eukprot:TRINITY_DN35908_c0_g1_i1.p1 TRINITY_DN35908_c0_g1~~TRINITY_DN35908_c0_g1_i1.p1  ORF type:complete len:174 (+),score=27.06 TRINITY_DN35908_c0_g1_i1:45-566(+)
MTADIVQIAKSCGLLTPSGTPAGKDVFNDVKVVGFYFSASWCPPCRQFSPMLAELAEGSEDFRVVLIPGDRTEEDYARYLGQYPFLGVPFSSPARATMLRTMNATMMPTLHIYNAETGELITTWGRTAVSTNKKNCVKHWKNNESGLPAGYIMRYVAGVAVALLLAAGVYAAV